MNTNNLSMPMALTARLSLEVLLRSLLRSPRTLLSSALGGVVVLVATQAAMVGHAHAQSKESALASSLARCRALSEGVARLACYDAVALDPLSPAAAPVRKSEGPAPAAAAVAPAAAAQQADFGMAPRQAPAAALQRLEARMVGRFEGWEPGTRLRLDNGQVWEVIDNTRATYDLVAPTVRIERGFLGSFFIEISGVSATPRVRRVQ